MSYLVLARKYRPRDFQALVGQPHVVQALANALTHRRLHHAYLFTGTRGVGKTTISRILAKSLNCTGADGTGDITAQPCGVCDACREIDAGRFVDYVELDAASNRGVDEISQLLDQAVYKPVVGRFKVYMIDEVHMLSNHAFNAMLKTLEEPPEYLKFVLATTDPQKVPPTVLSRCLQFNLRPLAPQTVQEHLAGVLAAEGIDAQPHALQLLARAAHGSMRDALSLADQAIAHGGGRVAEEAVRQMLGAVDRGHAARLVDALAVRDGGAVLSTIDGLRGLGLSAAGTLEEMAALLQQMAVQQAVPGSLDPDDPDTAETVRLAARLAPDETHLLYGIVLHGREELALAPDEYGGLVMVLLRFLAFPSAGGVPASRAGTPDAAPRARRDAGQPAMALASREPTSAAATARVPDRSRGDLAVPAREVERSTARVETTVSPVRSPETRIAEEPGPLAATTDAPAPSDSANRWTDIVRGLVETGAIGALVRELAMQAQCIAIDEARGTCRLRVERETLRAPASVEKLQAALAASWRVPVRLETEAGPVADSPALREIAERARRQAEAEATIQNDPLVRALMSQYKTARIVPGSVKSI
ncbi:MAG TPA: DNA polymerase III subunit gamma/tau [Caldimonas sp.]|nr:DNA polymerase III subunit gamma/tau [Caldimonas sp.]